MPRSATGAGAAGGAPAPAQVHPPDAVGALTEALADPDSERRAAAGAALAELRDPASIPVLARIVAGREDPALGRCRRAALHALVGFRAQQAAVELARALASAGQSPLDLHARSALLAVAYAEPTGVAARRVVRALVALLAHKEQPVAERAASLLMLFPSESPGPLARAVRTAPRPDVRRRAAQALGACRQDAAVAALLTALEDPAPGVRAEAARSLGYIRDPATMVALQMAGGDGNEDVREAARSALRKLGAVAGPTRMPAGFRPLAHRSHG